MTVDELKNRIGGLFTTEAQHQRHADVVSNQNSAADLAYDAPYLGAWWGAGKISPDISGRQIDFQSPMAKRLIAESGLDIGVLPKISPKIVRGPNAVYMSDRPGRFGNWLMNMKPSDAANWREHGMIAPLNTESMLPEVMAHELGHGIAHHGGGLAAALSHLRTPVGVGAGLMSAVDAINGMSDDKDLSERDRLLNRASLDAAVAQTPLLANEYHASSNAMKLLSELPASEAEPILARASRLLPRAWGTYGLMGLGGILAPQAAKYYYHHAAPIPQ
jgi:hypothetical protein